MAIGKSIKGEVAVDPVSNSLVSGTLHILNQEESSTTTWETLLPQHLNTSSHYFSIRIDSHRLLFSLCFTSVKG